MLTILTALSLAVLGGATPTYSKNISTIQPACVQKQTPTRTNTLKKSAKKNSSNVNRKVINKVIIAPGEIENLINKYAAEYKTDPSLMKRIAKCESGFNPNAVNGQHIGMYQYKASTWESTRRQMGLDPNAELRVNPEEAIKTTAFKIANGGVNAWKECI